MKYKALFSLVAAAGTYWGFSPADKAIGDAFVSTVDNNLPVATQQTLETGLRQGAFGVTVVGAIVGIGAAFASGARRDQEAEDKADKAYRDDIDSRSSSRVTFAPSESDYSDLDGSPYLRNGGEAAPRPLAVMPTPPS